jgi:ABC-2 type transport system permease protein
MKIYLRARTWIMYGFIVLLPVFVSILFYAVSSNRGDPPSNWSAMWIETATMTYLVTIFTVVVSADSVAGEFASGTIKLLLIRPWSRSSILLSKYVSVLLLGLAMTAATFIVTLLVNLILFGYSASPGDLPVQANGRSPLETMLLVYLLQFISLIVVATFGFMMSSAFRSGALAIGLSIFLLLSGSLITGLLSLVDKPWVKFVLFPHLQLTSYLEGSGASGPVPNHPTTLGFSLAVLAAYFILFNAVSWIVFRRRDVAA